MKKLMTSDDEKKVTELINTGKSPVEVSRELNINYPSVYYFVKKTGIYKRCHKYTKEEVRFIIENYRNMPADKISDNLKIPIVSIYNKARSLGLTKNKGNND